MTRKATNTVEGIAEPYLERVENVEDEIADLRAAASEQVKEKREDIKQILKEAKKHGIPEKALKGLVKHRQLARKQLEIAKKMTDIDEQTTYQQLVEALGPLGEAAARAAGYAPATA